MIRNMSMVVTILASLQVATAQESKVSPKTVQRPPYERILKGEDAKKAQELKNSIEKLQNQQKLEKSLELRKELLSLRERVQSADHWETINEKWSLASMRKIAGLPSKELEAWSEALEKVALAGQFKKKLQFSKANGLYEEFSRHCEQLFGNKFPETAEAYSLQASNLNAWGKYKDADPLFVKAFEIRRTLLGEKHPSTLTALNGVGHNLDLMGKYSEVQPLFERILAARIEVLGERHEETAGSLNNLAHILGRLGRHAEAQPLHERALKLRIELLGENNVATAISYSNLAENLDEQNKHDLAETYMKKSLAIWVKLFGEQHPDTATGYSNLAGIYLDQGRIPEAHLLYQKAFDIRLLALGEKHPDTIGSLNNLAVSLHYQNKFAEAEPFRQKALDQFRALLGDRHPTTAICYKNLAGNLDAQGKHFEASGFWYRAVELFTEVLGQDHTDTILCTGGLAHNLNLQNRYAEAQELHQTVIESLHRTVGKKHVRTAEAYSNHAVCLLELGQTAAAYAFCLDALDVLREKIGEKDLRTVTVYNNLALAQQAQGRHAQAEQSFRKTVAVKQELFGSNDPQTGTVYRNMSRCLFAQQKFAETREALTIAANAYEVERLRVAGTGLGRAAISQRFSPYPMLAATHARLGSAKDAWNAVEMELARGLTDELATRRATPLDERTEKRSLEIQAALRSLQAKIFPLATAQKADPLQQKTLASLLAERQKVDDELAKLASSISTREVASLTAIQSSLGPNDAVLLWVDITGKNIAEHWGCIVRSSGDPHWEPLPASGADGEWTLDDESLPEQFQAALESGSTASSKLDELTRKLHRQRIAPLSKHLSGVKRLFVVPVREMAGIPIEVLTDQFTITYVPSGTFIASQKENPVLVGNRLLALGDPKFLPPKKPALTTTLPPGGLLITQVLPGTIAADKNLQPDDVLLKYGTTELRTTDDLKKAVEESRKEKSIAMTIWRQGVENVKDVPPGKLGVILASEPAPVVAKRKTPEMLAKLRGGSWNELPGTRVEVERLKALFGDNTTVLTESSASEQALDSLRRSDRLRDFRYLHFATHGEANNVRAFESSLILAQDKVPTDAVRKVSEPFIDGQLSAAEVMEHWKLNADLVTLSACESAIGRKGGGDGMLGFAQAFLLAGSRSVCLSLWKVDDTATALLMDRFYRNLLGKRDDLAKPMGKAESLREAKTWLKNLSFEEAGKRLGVLTEGVFRGSVPAKPSMQPIPKAEAKAKDSRPYSHPRYWAAFILIGNSD